MPALLAMSTAEMTTAPTASTRRSRSTPEQMIADLQSQLATLKERAKSAKSAKSARGPVLSAPIPAMSRRNFVRLRAARPASAPVPAGTTSFASTGLSNSLDTQIQSCIECFSSDLVDLIQRTTLEAIGKTLGGLEFSGGSSTDNEPSFGALQSLPSLVPTRSRRAMAPAGSGSTRSSGSGIVKSKAAGPTPLSFEHYERLAIQRAIAETEGDVLAAGQRLKMTKSSIYRRINKLGIQTPARGGAIAISPDDPLVGIGEPVSLDAYEKAAIQRALDESGGNIIAAARLLKTGKSTMYRRMGVLGISARRLIRTH